MSEHALIEAGFKRPEEEKLPEPTEAELQAIGLIQEKGLKAVEGSRDFDEALRIVGAYPDTGILSGIPVGQPAPELAPDAPVMRAMRLTALQKTGELAVEKGLWQRRAVKARPLPPNVALGGYDGGTISTPAQAVAALAQADNDLMVSGSAFNYWQGEAVFMAESFNRAIGQVEEWQRLYNASARNRNAAGRGIATFLRENADKFEAGSSISCEGLEKLSGVSHTVHLQAQKVAAARSADLDRTLDEVEREMPRFKKARVEAKEVPESQEDLSGFGKPWNLLGASGSSAPADEPMTEGANAL